jgi:hypothetical protein
LFEANELVGVETLNFASHPLREWSEFVSSLIDEAKVALAQGDFSRSQRAALSACGRFVALF